MTHLLWTIIIGLSLSIGCFFLCNYYSTLWHKSYTVSLTHKALRIISLILTFFFVLIFSAFTYWEQATSMQIKRWEDNLKTDATFTGRCFLNAYYEVKKLGLEKFDNYPTPEKGGRLIPTNFDKSKLKAGEVYSNLAWLNFKEKHPFLRLILNSNFSIAPELIKNDMNRHFSKSRDAYSIPNGIEIAALTIKNELIPQTPKVVTVARVLLILSFLITQLITFGLIGTAAYHNLKIKT